MIATCSDDDVKCFAAIGSALHVNELIVGKVKKTSQGLLVVLQLVDVARARFAGSNDALVPAASAKWAHDAYHELVRIE